MKEKKFNWYICAGDHHRVYMFCYYKGTEWCVSTSQTIRKAGEQACLEKLERLMRRHIPEFTTE